MKGREGGGRLLNWNWLERAMREILMVWDSVSYFAWPLYQVFESESRSVLSDSLWHHGLYSPSNSPGQNTGVGSLSLLQGIFPTQGSSSGLPHCRWFFASWATREASWLGALGSSVGRLCSLLPSVVWCWDHRLACGRVLPCCGNMMRWRRGGALGASVWSDG